MPGELPEAGGEGEIGGPSGPGPEGSLLAALAAALLAERPARGRRELLGRLASSLALGLSAILLALWLFGPLLDAPPRPTIEVRAGRPTLPVPQIQHQIFASLALREQVNTARARRAFPDLPWSQQDHRAQLMRSAVRTMAARYRLTLSEVYLIYERGIREGWPGSDNQPLDATIVPMKKRDR